MLLHQRRPGFSINDVNLIDIACDARLAVCLRGMIMGQGLP